MDLGGGWRQPREVERESSEQCQTICGWRHSQVVLLQTLQYERIDGVQRLFAARLLRHCGAFRRSKRPVFHRSEGFIQRPCVCGTDTCGTVIDPFSQKAFFCGGQLLADWRHCVGSYFFVEQAEFSGTNAECGA